jgi:RNA polymerase sigma-70 factor (ECF subfamily)
MTPGTEAIFEDFHRRLRAFVSRRVRNAADGDDVLQETFLRIHRHLGGVRRTGRLAAWVFQIARSALADHYRRGRGDREIVEPQPISHDEENPVEETDGPAQIAACLAPMISSLPPSDRHAVQMTEIAAEAEGDAPGVLSHRVGPSWRDHRLPAPESVM